MFNLFKSFTLTWWQGSLLKAGMFSAGILFGIYFPNFSKKIKILLWVMAVVFLLYLSLVWF